MCNGIIRDRSREKGGGGGGGKLLLSAFSKRQTLEVWFLFFVSASGAFGVALRRRGEGDPVAMLASTNTSDKKLAVITSFIPRAALVFSFSIFLKFAS